MRFASIVPGSLVIILAALPAQAEPSLKPIPVSPNGIELPADHAGVRSLVQSFAKDPSTHVSIRAGGLENAIGRLSAPRAGNASDAAKAFVSSNLGLRIAGQAKAAAASGNALVVDRALENLGTNHIRFRHEVNGIPVRGHEVAVHLAADNTVTSVNGSYHELPAEVPAQTISDKEAIARATAHVGATALRQETTAQRVWVPVDGELKLAIVASIAAAQPLGDFEVAVDAVTGAIIGGENQLMHEAAEPVSDPGRVTAEGKVYPHSPLDHQMITAPLTNLNAKDKLVGAYVKVINADEDGAIAASGQFFYDEGNTHFAEVTVYRNLEMVHSYYKSLGFNGRDKQMKATVHYGDNYDNAFYSPMSDSMAFGDGNRLNNLALEDNVAFHEYTHGVNQLIASLGGSEGGAMNEATADYFACTMTGNPLMGVWVMRKLNKPWMRNLENKNHYPEDISGEVHKDGEIWGGVLWDVRKQFGAGMSDKLIFKSMFSLPSRPKFVNGLEAIIAADKALNGGNNVAKITEIFAKRGIKLANQAPELAGDRSLVRQAAFLGLVNP